MALTPVSAVALENQTSSRSLLPQALQLLRDEAQAHLDGLEGALPVRLATAAALPACTYSVANMTLTENGSTGALTVDGVVCANGDIILNKDGTVNNGPYVVSGIGGTHWILTRAPGANKAADFVPGATVGVGYEGTANKGLLFILQAIKPINADLNTTSLPYGAFSGTAVGATVPTPVGSAAVTAGVGAVASHADHVHAVAYPALAASLTDATTTLQPGAGSHTVHPLPAATLTVARSLTLGTTNVLTGQILRIERLDATPFAYTIINGGGGAGTKYVFLGGATGSAEFIFDGTNWALYRSPATQVVRSNVANVRGVIPTNVANLAAFVIAGFEGLTYAAGERVLLAGQTTAAENGIYVVGTVAGTAPLTRAADMPVGWAYINGMVVEVSEGTQYAGSSWKAMCTGAKVVGTDDPLFYPRHYKQTVTLAAGTYKIGFGSTATPDEDLFLFSTTKSMVSISMNTSGTAGGAPTLTTEYGCPVATRVAGKSGTGVLVVNAQVAAGTLNNADTSTLDICVTNW